MILRIWKMKFYYNNPESAFGLPEISLAQYPDKGFSRILDLSFTYSDNIVVLKTKQSQLIAVAKQASDSTQSVSPYDTVTQYYEFLRSTTEFDAQSADAIKGSSSMPYGALVEKKGDAGRFRSGF